MKKKIEFILLFCNLAFYSNADADEHMHVIFFSELRVESSQNMAK